MLPKINAFVTGQKSAAATVDWTLSMSLEEHNGSMPSRTRTPQAARGTDKTFVLVVEDESDIAGLIKHTLERGGDARVEVAQSNDQALKLSSEQPRI